VPKLVSFALALPVQMMELGLLVDWAEALKLVDTEGQRSGLPVEEH
jgi:hypothetical protein